MFKLLLGDAAVNTLELKNRVFISASNRQGNPLDRGINQQ